jgi:hypothetical protein
MEKTARLYGLPIVDVTFPYQPGFFGFSRFGRSFIGSPVTFSVLRITATQENFRAIL